MDRTLVSSRRGRRHVRPTPLGHPATPVHSNRLRPVRKADQDLRVLDLASLEGHYGIEFALQGAWVVATEGGPANLEKPRFAKEALGLDKLELVLDDVRNLSVDRGEGGGKVEFARRSFWLTKASLSNLLRHTGFTSVYECLNPFEFHSADWPRKPEGGEYAVYENRTTFAAAKGKRCTLISFPSTERLPDVDRPEHSNFLASRPLPGKIGPRSRLAGLLPRPLGGS